MATAFAVGRRLTTTGGVGLKTTGTAERGSAGGLRVWQLGVPGGLGSPAINGS